MLFSHRFSLPAHSWTLGLSVVASLLVSMVAGTAGAQPFAFGVRPPTPEEQAYVDRQIVKVTDVRPNALAKARVLVDIASTRHLTATSTATVSAVLPSSVDNSTLKYFPPIRDQGGQGSCTCWAACYYYNTFTQARDANVNPSGGNNNLICSPAFLYPLINDGVDEGSWTSYAVARLNDIGCCSWTLKPYSDSDYLSWPSEAAWVQALRWRTRVAHEMNGTTQTGINAIKQHLANGNVAATQFWVFWNFVGYPSNATGINNRVYYAPAGGFAGGHAVTLVGYDDNRTYVDHRDGRRYSGAFLVANSWGPSWGWYNSRGTGSRGFFWVAYRAFLSEDFGPQAWYNDDRPAYQPTLYAVTGINHDSRGFVGYTGGIGSTFSPDFVGPWPIARDGGSARSLSDDQRIAVDLTDGVEYLESGVETQVFAQVSISSSTSRNGTITSADFVHDFDGDGSYSVVSSTDPTVTIAAGSVRYATASVVGTGKSRAGIVWRQSETGDVGIWLMNDSGVADMSVVATVAPELAWAIEGVGDFDGDDDDDVLWRNTASGEVAIWVMNGTTMKTGRVVATVAPALNWEIKGVGDLDGDGRDDIIWRQSDTGEVAAWLMNGTTMKTGRAIATVAPALNWEIKGIGDLDGDEHDDIVWHNSDTDEAAVWLMNGTRLAKAGVIWTASGDWTIEGVGDFNGKGRDGILWYNGVTGEVAVWLVNGVKFDQGRVVGTVDPASTMALEAVGDFSGEGRADVLWRDTASGEIIAWFMNGTTVTDVSTVVTIDPDVGWDIKGVGDFNSAQ